MRVTDLWRTVAVLVLAVSSVRCTADVSNYCSDEDVQEVGYYCATCLHSVYCYGDSDSEPPTDTLILETCHQGEVCDGSLEHRSCIPVDDASQCQCTSYSQCDSYSPDYVSLCNEMGMYDVLQCEGEEEEITCSYGKCGAVVPGITSCEQGNLADSEWHFITPDCTKGFYCYENGDELPVQCKVDEYIDIHGDCLPAPPLPCASGCVGNCPDNLDCTRFYYCGSAGTLIDTTQCEEGFFFDPDAEPVPRCIQDETVCAPLTSCDFDLTNTITTTTTIKTPTTTGEIPPTTTTTTAGPPVCTSATTGNYPSGPCSPYYWSCRSTGGGNYDNILMECPDGLVFDTDVDTPFCNWPENVGTC